MSFEPFDIGVIVEHLKETVPALHEIGSAADFAAVKELRSFRAPCAFVVFAEEENTETLPTTWCTTQLAADAKFGVVLALRNYAAGIGGQMAKETRELIGQVRTALIGFRPTGKGSNVVVWQSGAVLDYDASTLLFADRYSVPHTLQKAAPCGQGR